MEIKLAENPQWKRSAILWFIFSAIQFWGAVSYSSFYFLISGILGSIVGLNFLTRMSKITYLTLQDERLTVHLRRLPFRKKNIEYSNIKKAEVVGKEIILHISNGRTFKLKYDWLSYDGFLKLKKVLEAHSISIK